MILKTFKGGYDSNFTYVVHDTTHAVILDPAVPALEVLNYIETQKLNVLAVVILHSHFDHVVDLPIYRSKKIPLWAHQSIQLPIDHKLKDNDTFGVGSLKFSVMHTPGHRYDCICLLTDKHLFTSDTLFIDSCGRVDFPGSDPQLMAETLEKLRQLPDDTIIYPGHDYGKKQTSTLGEQKKSNPFLKMSKEEFLGH